MPISTNAVKWGPQPYLWVVDLPRKVNGRVNKKKPNDTYIDDTIINKFEKYYNSSADAAVRHKAELLVESTILHEMVHWGDHKDGVDQDGEEGKAFERAAYGKDIKRYW